MLPSKPGTYILLFYLQKNETVQIGKLGKFIFTSGYYCYVGSAFGPGGLKARVTRHIKLDKLNRWHIDYIRSKMVLLEVWYTVQPTKLECALSGQLAFMNCNLPVNGFGASDCKCKSHLFQFKLKPELCELENLLCHNVNI